MSAMIKIFLFVFWCIVLASCAGKEKDGAKKEEAQPTTIYKKNREKPSSLFSRWRLPTLPLSQYHRRDKV